MLKPASAIQKRLLLQKAYDALPTGGALIVYEAIIDDDRSHNAFGLLMSLNMLIEGLGFDFTGADCRGWVQISRICEGWLRKLAGLIVAGGLLGDDVPAVEGVDHGDEGHQGGELILVIVLGGVHPGIIGDTTGCRRR